MKSRYLLFVPLLLISACNTPSIPPEPKEEYSKSIYISEINTGTNAANRAVELFNSGDEDLLLDSYSLNIYRRYSNEYTEKISLDGKTIKAKSTFIIAYSRASEEILAKADLISDEYLNDGTFPVALAYKDEVIDEVGKIGFVYDFAQYAVLVRKKEYSYQNVDFDLYHWIRYPINTLTTLGNVDVASEETLLEGPKLKTEDFNKPYCLSAGKGEGGVLPVTLSWTSDGDTSGFDYGTSLREYDISGRLSTRYYGINTPEIAHAPGEVSDPYGDEAKYFTNGLLNKAKKILIQSVNGYSLHETYGRMLGYVWISNVSDPKPEDYQLLNYLIIKNGFSNPAFISRNAEYNSLMLYEGVSFIEYLYDAQQYAIRNHLNIHSGE